MSKKLIGLTGPSVFTNECITMIEERFNANFVLLYHENEANLMYWAEQCDALILAGGIDIHPMFYNRNLQNHKGLSKVDSKRDKREIITTNHFFISGKPVLGICRGHQLIAIMNGLSPYFSMDISSGDIVHSPTRSDINHTEYDGMHFIHVEDNSLFLRKQDKFFEESKKIIGVKPKLFVNSFHHQAILYSARQNWEEIGIEILATAPYDFNEKKEILIVEAMRGIYKNWISVQWHPEFDYEVNIPSQIVLEEFERMMNEHKKK